MKKLTHKEFIDRATETHGGFYDYSKSKYINGRNKVVVTCPIHGDFTQKARNHLRGDGCISCGGTKKITTSEFIIRSQKKHGTEYGYEQTDYQSMHTKVKIICGVHGVFEQEPINHLKGSGCPKCANNQKYSIDEFVSKATNIHGGKYQYESADYDGAKHKIKITCKTHGDFVQLPNDHLDGHGCTKCASSTSCAQQEIADFIKSMGIKVEENNRTIITPKEIDILLPDHNLGIEYNGVYWHREEIVGRSYHRDKQQLCNDLGIELITIFEDEWEDSSDIVKSIIINRVKKTPCGVGARNLSIKELGINECNDFLHKHHIQSYSNASIRVGAFYNNNLVSVMTFGKPQRLQNTEYELKRFCSDGFTHPGVASRLFSFFIKKYNPQSIVTYSDNRWFGGSLYNRLGFSKDKTIPPDYRYVKRGQYIRSHKSKFRKDNISKRFNIDVAGSTEKEIMESLNYYRVYDCGKVRWVWSEP